MTDLRFHDLADGRRIAFRHLEGKGPTLVFLPGYMSDMDGGKATALFDWARGEGRACLLLDYSGCGRSNGDFADGTLSRWREEVIALTGAYVSGKGVLAMKESGSAAAEAQQAALSAFSSWQREREATEARELASVLPSREAALNESAELRANAKATGDAAATALGATAAALSQATVQAVEAQASHWADFSSAERTSGEAAASVLRGGAATLGSAVSEALEAAAAWRGAFGERTSSDEQAVTAAIGEHEGALTGLVGALDSFVSESNGVAPPIVPEREPHPYVEPFAATADDDAMRAHHAEHGDAPMERTHAAPASPASAAPSPLVRAVTASPTIDFESAQAKENGGDPKQAAAAASAAAASKLGAMKVTELRKLCDEYELPNTGNKSELINRLQKVVAAKMPMTPRRPRSDPGLLSQVVEVLSGGRKSGGGKRMSSKLKSGNAQALKEIAA